MEIFFPYHFLIQYLKSRVSLIREKDVNELFADIRSRWKDGDKGKGYCFQFALGVEFLTPASKLMEYVVKKIDGNAHPLKSNKIKEIF